MYVVYVTNSQLNPEDTDARVTVSARIRRTGRSLIDQWAAAENRTRSQMIGILIGEAVAARMKTSSGRGR